jgi:hypothetical protein
LRPIVLGNAALAHPSDRKTKHKNMQLKQNLSLLLTAALLTLGAVAQTQAQDKKADPTGTWTWTSPGRDGGEGRKSTLTLKTEGEKVTGKIASPGRQGGEVRETEIKNGKLKGDEISFEVTREFNGNSFTAKYKGKITGDTIKGKIETERNGETRERDWEAKRETAKKA